LSYDYEKYNLNY